MHLGDPSGKPYIAGMKHLVRHDLDEPTVRRVAEKALDAYRTRFPDARPTVTWTDPKTAALSFDIKGVKLNGSVELAPGAIAVDLHVPLLFRPFKGKAIAVVEEEIKKWIAEARAGRV